MDDRVTELLARMTTRRVEAELRRWQKRAAQLTQEYSARGTLNSGWAQSEILNTHAEAIRDAAHGVLADYLSVAQDIHATDADYERLRERYLEWLDNAGAGLRNGAAGRIRGGGAANEGLLRAAHERIDAVIIDAKNEAEITFERELLRRQARAVGAVRPTGGGERRDVFVSHAGEDREPFVNALVQELGKLNYTVWYSEYEITLGDSLRARIDDGLSRSRFGAVILSPAFFQKPWPGVELDALAARAMTEGRKVILPVWHGLTIEQLREHSPLLAGVAGVDSARGAAAVATEIDRAIKAEDQRQRV